MHLIKNVAEHVVRLISGAEDSLKVRREEQVRKRFPSSWITERNQRLLPSAPFRLKSDNIKLANERALSIRVPSGFDWRPRPFFQRKSVGMKSHEWKQVVSSGILKFCIRGLLGNCQRTTLFELCNVLEKVVNSELDILEGSVHRVLSLLERDFPTGAVTGPDSEEADSIGRHHLITLTTDQLKHLDSYYQETIAEYHDLILRYEQEK